MSMFPRQQRMGQEPILLSFQNPSSMPRYPNISCFLRVCINGLLLQMPWSWLRRHPSTSESLIQHYFTFSTLVAVAIYAATVSTQKGDLRGW